MRNVVTIAWRDIRSMFTSPIAYVVLTGFQLLAGWFFFNPTHSALRWKKQK